MGTLFAPPQNQPNFKPSSAFLYIPPEYPNYTTPGKIEILWNANNEMLWHRLTETNKYDSTVKYNKNVNLKIEGLFNTNSYQLLHKLSPYTEYSSGLLSNIFGSKEPFYYVYPDEAKRGINGLRRYETSSFPIGSAPIDVIRVSKFMISGRGIGFLAKQFLLQTRNVYNETRIFNPLSPVVASGMALGLGMVRPTRHLDIYGGLGGIANSLLGGLGSTIFGPPKINPPPGSIGAGLPNINKATGGKGLLRASTANSGKAHLDSVWVSTEGKGGLRGSFGSIVKGIVKSLFGNFIPQTQDGIKFKSDEGTYGKMLLAKHVFDPDKKGYLSQRWVAGGTDKIIRKDEEYPSGATQYEDLQFGDYNIGYDIDGRKKLSNGGVRYGDVFGITANNPENDTFHGSGIMIEWSYYQDTANDYKTKHTDKKTAEQLNQTLKDSINNINNTTTYYTNLQDDSTVIRSWKSDVVGYNRIMAATNQQAFHKKESPLNYPLGVLKDYREIVVVDNTITSDVVKKSKKFPINGQFDALNTLTVLDSSMKIDKSRLKGWEKYDPYVDDQIAFFFYDIVNQKYIPFRATVKGIAETGTAQWDELQFIGRSDKVYSYGGFTRALAFSFVVNISSIAELSPTYQRINYLSTLIKPANYTSDVVFNGKASANRFAIAPMIMLTIGDLYKDQPILIQNVNFTIPEDASWETLNNKNSDVTNHWRYLANKIHSTNVLYAQVPRTIEIQLSCILLEKERPIAGGANFGHAPRKTDGNENWKEWNSETPSDFHQKLIVNVVQEVKQTVKLPPIKMVQPVQQPQKVVPTIVAPTTPTQTYEYPIDRYIQKTPAFDNKNVQKNLGININDYAPPINISPITR